MSLDYFRLRKLLNEKRMKHKKGEEEKTSRKINKHTHVATTTTPTLKFYHFAINCLYHSLLNMFNNVL